MLNRAISGERQNLGESLWGGLTNAVSGRAGGYGKVKGAADAFRRGTLEGAARSVMNDIHDMAGIGDAGSRAYGRDSYSTGGDSADTALTNRGKSDPRTQCTPADTFNGGIGTQSTRGYRQSKSRGKNGTKSRFDLKKILKNAMFNGLMGGLTDTAFYGMDKAVDAAAVGFLGNQRGSGTQRRIAENKVGTDISKTDYYVTSRGDAVPSSKTKFEYNLTMMRNTDGKYVGEASNGPVRVRIEGPHPLDENFNGDLGSDHFIDHIHIEHRKNGKTGQWGKGWNNKATIPLSWTKGED